MSAKKTYYLLLSLTIVISLLTVGVLLLANSFLAKSSKKLIEYKTENAGVELSKKIYNKAAVDLKKYQELKTAVDEALPKEKDQAKAVKEIYQIAAATGVQIEEIKFVDSTLGQKTKTTNNNASPNAANTTPAASTSSTITQAKPIKNISGVLGLEMTIKVRPDRTGGTIDYNRFINFVDQLSLNRRSIQITNLTIAPKLKNAELTTIIFVKP